LGREGLPALRRPPLQTGQVKAAGNAMMKRCARSVIMSAWLTSPGHWKKQAVRVDDGRRNESTKGVPGTIFKQQAMRLILYIVMICVLALPGVAAPQNGLSLDEAVKQVKSQRDVRVLSAETVISDGKRMYRIKVLTGDGRVKYIWVDPGG